MRVLMGMPDKNSLGGPAACEPPFVEALKQIGIEVDEEVYVYGDKLTRTSASHRISRVLRAARNLRRRVRATHYDVVHLNTAFDTKAFLRDCVSILFLRPSGSKIFLKLHGSDARLLKTRNPVWSVLYKTIWQRVDGIGVLSSEEKENFVRAGINERKVFVVKNAVRRDLFHSNLNFAQRIKVSESTPVLLFIARFVPTKGLLDVIRACRIVLDKGHTFALLCVGNGPERRRAEDEAARLNLRSQVKFFGYVKEEIAAEFYAGSTMLLFPTYHEEGFPMVVFNSLAAGLPIITTRIRAAADYLREPDNCLWVEPRNPSMLAEKIIYLLLRPDAREKMAQCNAKLAAQFTPDIIAREYAAIYETLIEN
jgi:glycosyltransferase involved in cell wall biosynthesis